MSVSSRLPEYENSVPDLLKSFFIFSASVMLISKIFAISFVILNPPIGIELMLTIFCLCKLLN